MLHAPSSFLLEELSHTPSHAQHAHLSPQPLAARRALTRTQERNRRLTLARYSTGQERQLRNTQLRREPTASDHIASSLLHPGAMEAVARDEGAVQDQEQLMDDAGPMPLATLMVRLCVVCEERCTLEHKMGPPPRTTRLSARRACTRPTMTQRRFCRRPSPCAYLPSLAAKRRRGRRHQEARRGRHQHGRGARARVEEGADGDQGPERGQGREDAERGCAILS